jgi:hypothetical protein
VFAQHLGKSVLVPTLTRVIFSSRVCKKIGPKFHFPPLLFQAVCFLATKSPRAPANASPPCTTLTLAPCTRCRGTPASPRTSSQWATGAQGYGRKTSKSHPSCGPGKEDTMSKKLDNFCFYSSFLPHGH